jgi:hypothetical protein
VYEYNAVVDRVYDGDTLHAVLDLGFNLSLSTWVRLDGISTPELGTVKEPIVEGEQSTLALMALLADREVFSQTRTKGYFGKFGPYEVVGPKPEIRITTKISDSTEKYGRVLGVAFVKRGKTIEPASLNANMLRLSWAEPLHYELKIDPH